MSNFKNCSEANLAGFRTGSILPKSNAALILLLLALITACGVSKEEMEYREKAAIMAKSISDYQPGLAADTINGITHNFIKTANMKLKVKDVKKSTQIIEDLIALKGGYVTRAELTSEVESVHTIRFSKDSLKEIKQYNIANEISLRIPNKQLDSVIRSIGCLAEFTDFIRLNADDVKLKIYANQLAQIRQNYHKKRLENTIVQSKIKSKQTLEAENKLLESQAVADDKEIETYDLADQVNYSTLSIHLYQTRVVSVSNILAQPIVKEYVEPFTSKFLKATVNGFEAIKKFILFVIENWGALLILFIFYLGVIRIIKSEFLKNLR